MLSLLTSNFFASRARPAGVGHDDEPEADVYKGEDFGARFGILVHGELAYCSVHYCQ